MTFTLQPNRWYGWQMIPGYVGEGCVPFCCPCWINKVLPQKSGKGILMLDAWVTGYAEGVNNGEASLKMIHRGDAYLIAQILYPDSPDINRCVVISQIEFEWVRRFCPDLWEAHPPNRIKHLESGSISQYLDDLFRPSSEWMPELGCDEVTFCALRFDGEKRDNELAQESPCVGTYENYAKLHEAHFIGQPWKLHPDPLVNWGEFFWLQRSSKWSNLDDEAARLMGWLFTQLHDHDVPRGYEHCEYGLKYEALRERAATLAEEWMRRF
jgi:hypothetical protein